ncbi:MAG: M23 family metallopeptidase [Bacteroidetes bacterium]|nr:M23 family metallopeptidase [Bacteroidota bacterium]MBU1678396.1 M23 family metallopeptidase [Bacteroidota bacterium]MBU2508490.1 M23 family metallopeptidase [Bacteroidota bacterium]
MKNFYYFSKSKLKFVEVRNFYRKFIFLIVFTSVIVSFTLFGAYFVVNEFINPDAEVKSLQNENHSLAQQLHKVIDKLNEYDTRITNLSKQSNDLRLATNLEPLNEDDRTIGKGGAIFEDISPSNSSEMSSLLSKMESYLENIDLKIQFEINNYSEIENKLEYNKKLFDVIPAIKPSEGTYGDDFGMRYHPILKIRRMHNGIDILSNTGTKVYSPGAGRVEFVGRRGGYGKTIIIDHGFGYKSLYSHLSRMSVRVGQTIKRGDFIANTGSSGTLSTGPHLHYEIRHNGIALDPRNFIFDDISIFDLKSEQNN